jgi:hypothetical protein
MAYFVLGAWLIQGAVGVSLLIGWARHGRRYAGAVVTHVVVVLVMLGLWITFLATGAVAFAWTAQVVLALGIPFGETMMVRRSRQLRGITTKRLSDYGRAVVDVFRGRLPGPVVFHALFAGVVFFSALGVCIGATVAAST